MSTDETQYTTRRKILAASGSAAFVGVAGCLGDGDDQGDDDGTGDGATTTPEEHTITLLAEHAGDGHDHDDHDDHDVTEEGLTADTIGHACNHYDFDDSEAVEGTADLEDAPGISGTHQPFDVTFEGETGYVTFHADDGHDHGDDDHDHGDGELFAFFVNQGSVAVVEGHTVYEDHGDVPECAEIGMYVVAEPDHGEVVLELSA